MAKPQSPVLQALALIVICAVAGALLGWVHDVTQPVIDVATHEREQQTYASLVEGATTFEELTCDHEGCVTALAAKDASGTRVGTVVVASAKGYGGDVPVAVGFDTQGTVIAVTVMDNNETPGLGSRAAEPDYLAQYEGRQAAVLTADDVDFVSGATITSKAVLKAFDIAVESFEEVR